jgi:hypothetical protein
MFNELLHIKLKLKSFGLNTGIAFQTKLKALKLKIFPTL